MAFVKDCLRDDWSEAKCAIQHYQTVATAWDKNHFTGVSTRTEKDAELQRQSVHCESKDPHGDAAPQSGLTCTGASRTSGVGEALRINCVAVLHGVGGQIRETEDCLSVEEREAARIVCTATAVLTGDPASDHELS